MEHLFEKYKGYDFCVKIRMGRIYPRIVGIVNLQGSPCYTEFEAYQQFRAYIDGLVHVDKIIPQYVTYGPDYFRVHLYFGNRLSQHWLNVQIWIYVHELRKENQYRVFCTLDGIERRCGAKEEALNLALELGNAIVKESVLDSLMLDYSRPLWDAKLDMDEWQ